MIVAELLEEIRIAIPNIIGCLRDSKPLAIRGPAVNVLARIAAHGTCPSVPL